MSNGVDELLMSSIFSKLLHFKRVYENVCSIKQDLFLHNFEYDLFRYSNNSSLVGMFKTANSLSSDSYLNLPLVCFLFTQRFSWSQKQILLSI